MDILNDKQNIATVSSKITNPNGLAHFSLAVTLVIVAILLIIRDVCGIIGKAYWYSFEMVQEWPNIFNVIFYETAFSFLSLPFEDGLIQIEQDQVGVAGFFEAFVSVQFK